MRSTAAGWVKFGVCEAYYSTELKTNKPPPVLPEGRDVSSLKKA